MLKYIVCIAIISVAVGASTLRPRFLYKTPIETEIHHFGEQSLNVFPTAPIVRHELIHKSPVLITEPSRVELHEVHHPITTIEQHVAEHVAEVPTAVSHQSSTIVHGGAEKTTLFRKSFATYGTPVETELIHETPVVAKVQIPAHPITTTTIEEHVAEHIAEIPTAVSHQSSTIVHGGAEKIRLFRKDFETYGTPVETELIHHGKPFETYEVPAIPEFPQITKEFHHELPALHTYPTYFEVEHPVVSKVSETITHLPTAVSHQTSTIVHGGHEKVKDAEVIGVPAKEYGVPI